MNDDNGWVPRPADMPVTAEVPAGPPGPQAPSGSPGTPADPGVPYTATARIDPVPAGGPGPGPGPRPAARKTVPRGLFWAVLALLGVALLVIAGLVVLKPVKAAPAALSAVTPSSAGGGPASSAAAPASPAPAASSASAAAGAGSPSAGPVASATATAAPATSGTNLFNLTPVQNTGADNFVNGSEEIGTITYPDSVRFTCTTGTSSDHTFLIYDVAGFSFLNAQIGVPSDATNAAGNTLAVTFFKDGTTQQLGKTVTVALDQPAAVHLNLDGASQLEIGCAATSTSSQQAVSMDVALGNAVLAG